MILIHFAYIFCLSPYIHMCIYIHTQNIFTHDICMHIYIYIYTHAQTQQINNCANNNYYSLSIVQNKATIPFHFLFLSSYAYLCTFACAHLCANENLVRAVFVHLWLNCIGLKVKKTVTNPESYSWLLMLFITRIILKNREPKTIFLNFHAAKSLFFVFKQIVSGLGWFSPCTSYSLYIICTLLKTSCVNISQCCD